MSNQFPFSEKFRVAAVEWVDAEFTAQLLEDMKSVSMSQRQTALGDIPVNRAEQIVKASPGWEEYVKSAVEARRDANLAKVNMQTEQMRFWENQGREASVRAEMKL